MSQLNLAIVIPALNEESTLPQLMKELATLKPAEIIVINDFSQDRTARVAAELGATVLNLADPLGAWGATQAGLRYACEKKFPLVVTMDADGQHLPGEIAKLINYQAVSGANIVVGSCVERGSPMRHWAWRILRCMSDLSVRDLTSGFRLYDHHAQQVATDTRASLLDYQDIGLLLLATSRGLSISETPVEMLPRRQGASRVFRSWWFVAYYMAYSGLLALSKRRPRTTNARASS